MSKLLAFLRADDAESAQHEQEELNKYRARIALFLRTDFLKDEFEPKLRSWIRQWEPKPGNDLAEMNYQAGVRDGLRMVQDFLDGLRSEMRNE